MEWALDRGKGDGKTGERGGGGKTEGKGES